MPRNALRAGVVDHQVSAADAGTLLAKLADRDIEEQEMDPDPQRYTALADEAEHALSILGKRLSEATSDVGQRAR
jgi:hypothetical protein